MEWLCICQFRDVKNRNSGKALHVFSSRQLFWLLLVTFGPGAAAFEQDHRINGLTMQFGTDSFATANAFGRAMAPIFQSQLQTIVSSAISSGSTSLLFEMPGLADLRGVNDPSFKMGVVSGAPVGLGGNPKSYSGTADLDWWYEGNLMQLDTNGRPKNQIAASISASKLTAGPAEIIFDPSPVSATGYLAMSSALIKATVGASSAPLISTNQFPPGHLPDENINPLLVSFASMTAGQLKGNISAASLASIPLNLTVTTDQGYTSSNSVLDLLVSGATTLGGLVRLVSPTQPDQIDPNAPVAGAGPPYLFTANAAKQVVACKDKNGNTVSLSAGLAAAAYSAYFTFTTDRVIDLAQIRPVLGMAVKSNTIILYWSTNAFGFSLEYATNLGLANWLPALPKPSIASFEFNVTNTIGETKFYRLAR